MLDDQALSQFHPVVMTPSHDGKYFYNYVLSLLNFSHACGSVGMPLQVYLTHGESLVTRARNNTVAEFLANPQWTHLFWIDSDIGFSPEAALRLLRSGYDVAAGVYPLKRQNWPDGHAEARLSRDEYELRSRRYTVNTHRGEKPGLIDLQVQPDGFMEMNEAPTGFMVIKRSVFERMMAAYPDLQYVPDSQGVIDRGLHYLFFDTSVDPVSRHYLSEDYHFCRLWNRLGGKVYVDACSNLTHQGSQLFTGNFANTLVGAPELAVGAPAGSTLHVSGLEHLRENPQGAA